MGRAAACKNNMLKRAASTSLLGLTGVCASSAAPAVPINTLSAQFIVMQESWLSVVSFLPENAAPLKNLGNLPTLLN